MLCGELAGEPTGSWRQRAARPRQTDNEAAARLWTCGRCARAHRQPPWTTLASCPPPLPSPTTPQPSTTTLIPCEVKDKRRLHAVWGGAGALWRGGGGRPRGLP